MYKLHKDNFLTSDVG